MHVSSWAYIRGVSGDLGITPLRNGGSEVSLFGLLSFTSLYHTYLVVAAPL